MQIRPARACNIITACCVLFNLSKDLNEPNLCEEDDKPHDIGEDDVEVPRALGDVAAIAVRAEIIRTFAM